MPVISWQGVADWDYDTNLQNGRFGLRDGSVKMKLYSSMIFAMALELVSGTAQASLTWNLAGGGNWDTNTANWVPGPTTFSNDGTVDVIFNNIPGGTITISSNMSPNSTTVSAASGTNTFSGGPIASGSLTKSGAGMLILSSTNTYSGGTTVSGGVLSIQNLSALGSGTAVVNGAQLLVDEQEGTLANNLNLRGINTSGGGSAFGTGALTFHNDAHNCTLSGTVTLAGHTTIRGYSAGGMTFFNNPIGGTGNLAFEAGGAVQTHVQYWLLCGSSASTYTGTTRVSANPVTNFPANCVLKLNGGNLPASTVLTLEDVKYDATRIPIAVFDLNGQSQTLAGLARATATGSGVFVNNTSSTNAILTISNSVDSTFSGVIGKHTAANTGIPAGSDNITLVKAGPGTLTLTGPNTYIGGTIINGGTLKMSVPLVASVMLTNPSFETDVGVPNGFTGYTNITAWTNSAVSHGIEQGNSRTWAPAAPPNQSGSNNKWAFIQAAQTMSQSFNITTDGLYSVSFAAAGRPGSYAGVPYGPLDIQVQIDGINQTAQITPSTNAWNTYTSSNVTLSAGNHTLGFVFINTLGGDKSAVLDAVTITGHAKVEISTSGIFDVSAQPNFDMAGIYVFDINGSQAGMLNASGLIITNAIVNLNIPNMSRKVYVLANYSNLTGSAFASVTGLPYGYMIDYSYNGGKQIALHARGTVIRIR